MFEMSARMKYFKKLCQWSSTNKKVFPLLPDALKRLKEFVGAEREKEMLSKTILFYISSHLLTQPKRRSVRKRKRVSSKPVKRARQRSLYVEDDSDSDFDPSEDEIELTQSERRRAMRVLIRQVIDSMEEDEEEEDEEDEELKEIERRRALLDGHFLHAMLSGDPGTGKTTFADILVDIWCALGIAKRDRYIKTTRSDWIGKYQGHSVAKAKELMERAKGGVIFIDEAYSLIAAPKGDDMYGSEVLTEIVEAMTSSNVIFIMAGYADDMKRLYNNNKGLERRIGFMFEFKKPSGKQLFDIFEHQLKRHKWRSRRSDRSKLAEFFSCQKMPFGGGSTEQLIFHCKQIAVVRQFPEAHQKIITLQDLKEATKSMAENKRSIKNMPIGVKHMYL